MDNLQLAQIKNKFLNPQLQGQTGPQFVGNLLSTIVTLGFVIGSIIFIIMLIMGGAAWISSGGDKASVEAARGRITHALIGIVVLFAVFVVIGAVQTIFGLNILNFDISRFSVTSQ